MNQNESKIPLGRNLINNSKLKAMIVDDSELVRSVIKQYLSSQDFDIVGEASNGEECIEKLKKINMQIDVLIIDCEMPKKNGVETVAEIRKTNQNIKIMMLTTHNEREIVEKAIRAGVNAYILKNFDRQFFLSKVARMLGRQAFDG